MAPTCTTMATFRDLGRQDKHGRYIRLPIDHGNARQMLESNGVQYESEEEQFEPRMLSAGQPSKHYRRVSFSMTNVLISAGIREV